MPDQSICNLEHWTKTKNKCVKVIYDAALFKNLGKFGVGWIARNDKGELIHAVSLRFNDILESHLAEAVGIREALSSIKTEEYSC